MGSRFRSYCIRLCISPMAVPTSGFFKNNSPQEELHYLLCLEVRCKCGNDHQHQASLVGVFGECSLSVLSLGPRFLGADKVAFACCHASFRAWPKQESSVPRAP